MLADDTWPSTAEVLLGARPGEASGDLRRYHLIAELARGGMGIVRLAVRLGPRGFQKLVVLKELRGRLPDRVASITTFVGEAHLAARLTHPNIVQTIETGTDRGRSFVVMEYLDGQPLLELVQRALMRAKRIPLPMHLGVLIEVLAALEYAHDLADFDETPLGIVHGEVNPHNVFVTYEGQVKLVDFGNATTVVPLEETVVSSNVRYKAPEQAAGIRPDKRADVFAVGVMLWEAIVGRPPWEGRPDAVVLQNLASGVVPHLRDAWPDIDPGLGAIVDCAMSADPAERYSTALEMRQDLERYIGTRRLMAPTARVLGATVSRLFADERESRRILIEAQLHALTVKDRIDPTARRGDNAGLALKTQVPLPETTVWWPSTVEGVPSSNTAPSVLLSPAAARTGSSKIWPTVGTLGLTGLLALASVGVTRLDTGNRGPAIAGAVTSASFPVGSTRAEAKKSHVVLSASPASAQLFLDDEAVPNPYVADLVRTAVDHRLRAEAPGYETKSQTFSFAEDIHLEIGLARTPPAQTVDRTGSTPPGCSPPYVVDSATGKKRWRLECL